VEQGEWLEGEQGRGAEERRSGGAEEWRSEGVEERGVGKNIQGLGVVDLRNGNEWILPDVCPPVYIRKYNFDALDNLPTKQP
jgi:hypothetical protein